MSNSSWATNLYPPSGRLTYEPYDRKEIASHTPIPAGHLPPALLESNGLRHRPPMLRLGWSIDTAEAMDVIRKLSPKVVRHTGPQPHGLHNESVDDTLNDDGVSSVITHHAGLEDDAVDFIHFERVLRKDGREGYALIVGDNHDGVLEEYEIEAVGEVFRRSKNDLCWHLDPIRWKWSSRSGRNEALDDEATVVELVRRHWNSINTKMHLWDGNGAEVGENA